MNDKMVRGIRVGDDDDGGDGGGREAVWWEGGWLLGGFGESVKMRSESVESGGDVAVLELQELSEPSALVSESHSEHVLHSVVDHWVRVVLGLWRRLSGGGLAVG